MKALARRGFLRLVAAAPAAAGALGLQTKLAAHGMTNLAAGSMAGVAIQSPTAPMKFTSFGDWWTKFGEVAVKKETKHVAGLDADLLDMRLPLTTKVRIQRTRNYERAVEDRRQWFADRLSLNSVVDWWP
jgi:hypothetical protein